MMMILIIVSLIVIIILCFIVITVTGDVGSRPCYKGAWSIRLLCSAYTLLGSGNYDDEDDDGHDDGHDDHDGNDGHDEKNQDGHDNHDHYDDDSNGCLPGVFQLPQFSLLQEPNPLQIPTRPLCR